jgi:cell division protein FtsZ
MDFKAENGPENVVTIKVIGVGGAGNNVVNRMVKSGTQGVEFIAVNTDKQALAVSSADQKIQIGEKLTHGQGAGSDPEVGKRSAEESRSNIAKAVENADMVFITAGMGGGTGTGAAPTWRRSPRESGVLTVGVVTKPFKFEGKRRMDQADVGIQEMLGKVDSLLIIPNDRLKFATDQKVTLANAFEIADDVLRRPSPASPTLSRTTGFINLDFADVTTIMKDAGFAHMGVGTRHRQGQGGGRRPHGRRRQPADGDLHKRRHGVLINITGSEDMGLEDVETAASLVQEAAHPDANIIFGATFDDKHAGRDPRHRHRHRLRRFGPVHPAGEDAQAASCRFPRRPEPKSPRACSPPPPKRRPPRPLPPAAQPTQRKRIPSTAFSRFLIPSEYKIKQRLRLLLARRKEPFLISQGGGRVKKFKSFVLDIVDIYCKRVTRGAAALAYYLTMTIFPAAHLPVLPCWAPDTSEAMQACR